MKNKYKIRYSSLFYNDLNRITYYMKNKLQNLNAAKNFITKVEQAVLERSKNPLITEPYKSLINRKNTYYRIYVKNYTIFYVVKKDLMEVRRILYSRRNLKKMI